MRATVKPTLERLTSALKDALLEYRYDGDGSYEEVVNALSGKVHRTVADLGYDSLDLVEIIIAIEDDMDEYFEDSKLEGLDLMNELVEKLPVILLEALN